MKLSRTQKLLAGLALFAALLVGTCVTCSSPDHVEHDAPQGFMGRGFTPPGGGFIHQPPGFVPSTSSAGKTLVVMIGQSNAMAHDLASNLSAANASLASAYPNVKMLAQQDQTFGDDPMIWQAVGPQSLQSETYNAGGGAFPFVGFELSMMHDLDIAKPGCCAFARVAVGGSSSVQWDFASTYPTSPPAGPNLYAQAVTYIQGAMTSLGCTNMVLVWEQGEGDAKTTTAGTAYLAWLQGFVDHLRSSLGSLGPGGSTIPFVYGKLNADADPATYLGLSQLRSSQVSFEGTRTNVKLVNQDSLPQSSGLYDGTHYNANGYVKVGHLFSPAVAAYLGFRVQPVALFSYSPSALVVTFTDASISPGDTITTWDWDWGDATAHGTTQNPSHTYAGSGTYNVTEKVTNSAGDSNTSAPVAVSVIGGITGVSRDSLSSKYVPANATEWGTFLTAIGSSMSAPDALYLLQEASGNAADSIGSIALTAANTPAYQQAVANWTRKAITVTDGTSKRLNSTSASLPDLSTTSMLAVAYVLMPAAAPAAARNIIEMGTSAATRADVQLASTHFTQTQSTTTNTATGTGNPVDGLVHPVALKINRTGSAAVGYTDIDKMTPTFGAGMTGKSFTIGATVAGNGAMAGGYLYVAIWFGAKAEVTDAQIKALLQGLGWTIPWTSILPVRAPRRVFEIDFGAQPLNDNAMSDREAVAA